MFCLPSQWWVKSERKNLLLLEQILSFMNRPHFGRVLLSDEENRKSQNLFPLKIKALQALHDAPPLR